MPQNDSETFRGYPIESLANSTSTRMNWPVDDRVLFLQHDARYQITKANMADCGADELYTKLRISARPEYYKRVVGWRVTSALVYLVTDKLRKSGLLVKKVGRDQITGAQVEIWRWPSFTRNWLVPGWTGNQDAPDDWDGELREDVLGRRASTPNPAGRGRGRHSNHHGGHARSHSHCLDTDKHALWPRLSACEPDPALSEEALSIATESLRFAQSELKHWFLAGVAGTQGDLEVEHRHLCAARYAGTLRLQHANQAIIVLKEARKNEPQGLVMDSPIWGMLLKVGPEWERAYDEEAEEDRRL